MAKVNDTDIYTYDTMPSLMDFLLGSDADNLKKTRSYKLKAIVDLINGSNFINNIQFQFSDGSEMGVDYNTPGYMFTDGNITDPRFVEKIIFNKLTQAGLNLSALFSFLGSTPNMFLKITNPSNPNNFFTFKITDFTDAGDFVAFDVMLFNDLYIGVLTNNFIYSIYWDNKESTTFVDSPTIAFSGNTASVKPKSITFDKIKDILFKTFLGRNTAGDGEVEEVTMTQARGMLDINNVDNTSDADKPVSSAQLAALNLKADQATTYTKTEVDAKVASVYKIRGSVANFASLPSTGQLEGDVWNLLDNGDNYAWVLNLNNTGLPGWDKLSGTVDLSAYETKTVAESKYLQIVNTSAAVLATLLTGISFATGGAIVYTDSVLIAFGKIQKNITDIFTALDLKAPLANPTFTGNVSVPDTVIPTGPINLQQSVKSFDITGNNTALIDWNGAEVFQKSSGTLTISPITMPASLRYVFAISADTGVSINWAKTGSLTWKVLGLTAGVAPPTMTQGQMALVSIDYGSLEIVIKGL